MLNNIYKKFLYFAKCKNFMYKLKTIKRVFMQIKFELLKMRYCKFSFILKLYDAYYYVNILILSLKFGACLEKKNANID